MKWLALGLREIGGGDRTGKILLAGTTVLVLLSLVAAL